MNINGGGPRWAPGGGGGAAGQTRPSPEEAATGPRKRVRLDSPGGDPTEVPEDAPDAQPAGPAAGGAPERLEEQLAIGRFPAEVDPSSLLGLVPPLADPGAIARIPPGGARAISLDEWPAPPLAYVSVLGQGGAITHLRALSVEMGEGLVIASRAHPDTEGIVSTGFTSCKALIFVGREFVGLAQDVRDSDGDLTEAVNDHLKAFMDHTGETAVGVVVGYSVQGMRDDCDDNRNNGSSVDDFVAGSHHGPHLAEALRKLPQDATEDQRWDCVTDTIAERTQVEIQEWSDECDLHIVELPHCAVLVSLEGKIHLFDEEPETMPFPEPLAAAAHAGEPL